MEELHQVVAAEPMDGFKVFVTFENGVSGVFDCEYLTSDPYWAKLKSPAFFPSGSCRMRNAVLA